MEAKLILYPLLAMFVLTCLVAATLIRHRIAFYKSHRIHPRKTATSAQMAATMEDSRAADNFRSLFEVPVLFYVAVLAIFAGGFTRLPHLVFAWGFVAARAVQSYIHFTSNVVMWRFYAYLTGWIFLLCTWLMLAWQLLVV